MGYPYVQWQFSNVFLQKDKRSTTDTLLGPKLTNTASVVYYLIHYNGLAASSTLGNSIQILHVMKGRFTSEHEAVFSGK